MKRGNSSTGEIIGGIFVVLVLLKIILECVAEYPLFSVIIFSIGVFGAVQARRWFFKRALDKAPNPTSYAPAPTVIEPREISKTEKRYRDELRYVEASESIRSDRIMGWGEVQIFYGAREALKKMKLDKARWYVHAQASMGEIFTAECGDCKYKHDGRRQTLSWRCDPCYDTYKSFSSKRPDLVICDNKGIPILVIEHQGAGHIDNTTPQRKLESELRNQVKVITFKKAGVTLLETWDGMTSNQASELIVAKLVEIIGDEQVLQDVARQ